MSSTSSRSMYRSKSNHLLPVIPGNDLKAIKEIFTKAKKYRDLMSHQKIQVKNLPKSNVLVTKPPRMKSIPKSKVSENSIKDLNYNTPIKVSEFKQQSTPSKASSQFKVDKNQDIPRFYSSNLVGSCPQLPSINKESIDTSLKKRNKKSPSHSKKKYKYQIKVSIDKNGYETSYITKQKVNISKPRKKSINSTKNIPSEVSSSQSASKHASIFY